MNDDTPAPCADCNDTIHDTLCDACRRLVCYGCLHNDNGASVCSFCYYDRSTWDNADPASYDTDPTLGAAIDDYVTRPPPECPTCNGHGYVRAAPSHFVSEHVNDTHARCPSCNAPDEREPLQDDTGCDV